MEISDNEKLEKLIQKVAADLNYMIYESAILLKGENSKFYIKIDHLNGISHKDCEIFSNELTNRLDKEEILTNYTLEISSPGLQRKLRNINEFTRFTGSKAKVVFEQDGKRTVLKGIINNVIDTTVELKSDKEEVRLDINNIVKANLEL